MLQGNLSPDPPRDTWMDVILRYNKPNHLKSIWQIANSVVPYVLLWVLMVHSLDISYWLTLLLSIFAAGFLVRIFIIFHDCVHGSFFKSQHLNSICGVILGALAFTPFHRWQYEHLTHHRTVGNLDKRGIGDVKTLTVEEYRSRSRWQQFRYHFYRHPIFLFGIAPILLFLLKYRFTSRDMTWKMRYQTYLTNSILLLIYGLLVWMLGWKVVVLIQLPILYISAVHGVWLFYVQHQFEDVVWSRTAKWNYQTMAIRGSSFFKLPAVLQWFTGNIGFHHIHHLSPLIPNYNLEQCHKENEMFQSVKPLTFWLAFKTMRLRLWDEQRQHLVRFKDVKG